MGGKSEQRGLVVSPEYFPWKRKWQPTPVLLSGNPMDRGACGATAHGVAKESGTT